MKEGEKHLLNLFVLGILTALFAVITWCCIYFEKLKVEELNVFSVLLCIFSAAVVIYVFLTLLPKKDKK